MDKLTQEELNALSPRARKAYEGDNVISEILTENPNAINVTAIEVKPVKKKKEKQDEKF
jgi:hypothetical protein|tara:strand:- start:287 stop:463 length:177 start_codon:yes stop_codon:yes gene_type:complete